jgi:hypothetical protein
LATSKERQQQRDNNLAELIEVIKTLVEDIKEIKELVQPQGKKK